jgi:hypothetical protein
LQSLSFTNNSDNGREDAHSAIKLCDGVDQPLPVLVARFDGDDRPLTRAVIERVEVDEPKGDVQVFIANLTSGIETAVHPAEATKTS